MAKRWPMGPTRHPPTDAKVDMAKNAVRVAVRNVVRVAKAPPALVAKGTMMDRRSRQPDRASGNNTPELLSGVSWDDGRKVWLVHPVPLPARG